MTRDAIPHYAFRKDMKLTHTLLITPILLLLYACEGSHFEVNGTISHAKDSMLYLEAFTLEGIQPVDSVRLSDRGIFELRGDAVVGSPEFFALRIGDRRIPFSVDSTETLTFHADLPTMGADYEVAGSENARRIREIHKAQQRLQTAIVGVERNPDLLPGDAIDSIQGMLEAYKERMKHDYIYRYATEAAGYYAVCQSITDRTGTFQLFDPLTERADVKCYAAVATAWDGRWPDSPRTHQLCNMAVKGMRNTAPPQQRTIQVESGKIRETGLLDLSLPDIDGQQRTLTALRGQVVLLDFTLYGAQNSAHRTRLMRQLYEKYHSQGLEIYQVSLDPGQHFWKFSCEKLPWICVHDEEGTAAQLYAVSNLPTFFLINRDNEVVKRSELISDLESEIQSLL